MNHLQCLENVERVRLEVESIRLESLFKQIDTTLALLRIAETLYRSGSTSDADRFYAKAWEAYYEASDQLKSSSIDQERRDHLADTLRQIRVLLHALSPG
jgi:hypothetical protein